MSALQVTGTPLPIQGSLQVAGIGVHVPRHFHAGLEGGQAVGLLVRHPGHHVLHHVEHVVPAVHEQGAVVHLPGFGFGLGLGAGFGFGLGLGLGLVRVRVCLDCHVR